MNITLKKTTIKIIVIILLVIVGFLFLANILISTFAIGADINIWAIFLTGLLTGGLTCLAVQGGLLTATIAQREDIKKSKIKQTDNAFPILVFLLTKLVAYTFLGLLLGLFGSLFQLSLTVQIVMQAAVIIFMLGTAMNILNVHPIFRYFVIQPPKFFTRLVRKQTKSQSLFAPAALGGFTVFIPCGTTQAMMALAIASANPFLGATILFAFVLGTSPLFFTLGYFATRLGESLHNKFMKIAALSLTILAVFNLNNVLALSGSNFNLTKIIPNVNVLSEKSEDSSSFVVKSGPVKEATIEFTQAAYVPNQLTVKAGSEVTLNLVNEVGRGCVQAFTIPKLGIQKVVLIGSTDKVSFTAPSETGPLAFMCSMGMYQGVINVI